MVHQGTAIMVMEFVDGETFAQMIRRRGPIPEVEAIPLFRQALLGIGYAHRAGILHRDIKPSNLMLNKNGLVKVMDFGIAKVMGARGMTRTGTQLGTLAYMSPEQIQNRNVDIRSDIYELGITLYEMLTGHLPFESDSEFQIMQDHVYTPPPPPSKYYPYINKGVEKVILKSIEKNSDARFQTVEQFGAALEHPDSLAYTPSVAPADAPTASIGGGSTLSHPHLSVSAVPPVATAAATPAPSYGATPAAASVATPVPLPPSVSVSTVPGSPAMAATRVPAPTILQSSTQVPTQAPTQIPIATAKSKKPLMIAGAAARAASRRRRCSLSSLEPSSAQRRRLVARPASRSIDIARSQRTVRSHSRDRRTSSDHLHRASCSGSQTKTGAHFTPARSTSEAERTRSGSRAADVSKGTSGIQPGTLLRARQRFRSPLGNPRATGRQSGGQSFRRPNRLGLQDSSHSILQLRKLPSGTCSRERNAEVLSRQSRAAKRTTEIPGGAVLCQFEALASRPSKLHGVTSEELKFELTSNRQPPTIIEDCSDWQHPARSRVRNYYLTRWQNPRA